MMDQKRQQMVQEIQQKSGNLSAQAQQTVQQLLVRKVLPQKQWATLKRVFFNGIRIHLEGLVPDPLKRIRI